MVRKMCVIRACWMFQKSKMMGYIPVRRQTIWAPIWQIPALVRPFYLMCTSIELYSSGWTISFQWCALRKIEESLVPWTCEIQSAQCMISMKRTKIFYCSCLGEKIGHQGPLGAARTQPWLLYGRGRGCGGGVGMETATSLLSGLFNRVDE